ncbi:YtxH domain-containing protein [Staphylococcus durrellii]|uniref:YtxH domain-containing protein n=1 Tax=Staphylococcus durrellii TaxID=2781773 RepID=UPI00189FB4D0|nr:YtxH domain-containing protein [Staphylococcus durrellii]MBF7016821.1 YtxH domain-containing protein [Staphylococcus durrellii]
MAKLFKAVIGIGGALAAVVLSNKDNREKLKKEYNKYKSNPESYKQNAKEFASQISGKASETFNEVKEDPKGYANKVKEDPKGFLNEQKAHFKGEKGETSEEIQEGRFDDEGPSNPNNNLRVVTEEELKNNKNK